MTILSEILKNKIVAIIRGAAPGDVMNIANALLQGGVNTLEITLNSPNALLVIRELVDKLGNEMIIGAGTVLNANAARVAIEAGAKFIVSPNVNIETISITKSFGVVSIPGAYTATEIVTAYGGGGDIIKIFPATNAGYIKALNAPLSHIPMMPTGGIHPGNIAEFQKAGGVAFGVGTALVDTTREPTGEYLKQVTENARKFVEALS